MSASPEPRRARTEPRRDEEALERDSDAPAPRYDWRLNLGLLVLTVFSVFFAGASYGVESQATSLGAALWETLIHLPRGWPFAVPLLAILLAHEFGHWIAARLHRVPASLPYFLPLPLLSPFGTLGAVIAMPRRIRSRNALLDIGAAGPLAGMAVALPVLVVGLSLSTIDPGAPDGQIRIQEGQSLLYALLKYVVVGPIPRGHDVLLHPTAYAGWAGLLVTMINLLPWGQLDGGHIAYALFGPRQNHFARAVRYALLPLFLYNLLFFLVPVAMKQSTMSVSQAIQNSLFWLLWFVFLGVVARWADGSDHPPTEPGELSPGRKIVAVGTLVLFVLLFMPTPMAVY